MTDIETVIELSPAVTVTPTGLVFKGDVSFDEWQGIGVKLKELRGMIHWWIGDWLNYGERRWGERYTQALEETQYAYQTLRNDKYIANEFPVYRRRDKLKFAHHAAVAGLEPEEQDRLLDIAEQKDLKREAFRELIAERKEDMAYYESLSKYPTRKEWDEQTRNEYKAWVEAGKRFFA